MRKHAQNPSGSNARTQLADYFEAIADTLEWNPEAWRALRTRLHASGTSAGDLTLGQIHGSIHASRQGDDVQPVLPADPRHRPGPALGYRPSDQGDSASNCPTTPEIRRARVSAEITLRVSEDRILLSGALDMGGLMVRSTRGWRRIENGWTLTSGPVFFRDHEDLLGHELAEYLGNLPLPLALADALQEQGRDDNVADVGWPPASKAGGRR